MLGAIREDHVNDWMILETLRPWQALVCEHSSQQVREFQYQAQRACLQDL